MEIALNVGSALEHLPTTASIIVSLGVLAFSIYVKFRTTRIEGRKTDHDIHLSQIESLMNQIKLLSDELNHTRNQLAELHNQNLELMGQLREANKRISELEITLAHYTTDDRSTVGMID